MEYLNLNVNNNVDENFYLINDKIEVANSRNTATSGEEISTIYTVPVGKYAIVNISVRAGNQPSFGANYNFVRAYVEDVPVAQHFRAIHDDALVLPTTFMYHYGLNSVKKANYAPASALNSLVLDTAFQVRLTEGMSIKVGYNNLTNLTEDSYITVTGALFDNNA